MRSFKHILRFSAIAAACACAVPALATNGYFPHGYGIKAQGMGGAATAMAEDSLGGATNPAKMVWVGSRADLGLILFSPHRDAERSGAAPQLDTINGKIESNRTLFPVPEFGYNRMMRDDLSLGVSVYGNGGMNTTYPQGSFQCPTQTGLVPANILCGVGEVGVDLAQLVVAPTVAYKVNPQHSVGASLLLGYQRFKATGIQAFGLLSSDTGNLTNRGYDSATGAGLRVGYMGKLSDMVTIGAAYSTKIDMGEFDKYRGLFAEAGKLVIPSNYSLGVAVTPAPRWTVALDYQRINYSDSRSVSNPSQPPVAPLGATNGPGFGWQDIDIYKIGVAWQMNDAWTLRAGYNRGDNPITPRDVTFNILAPGVMKEHYTLGFTYAMGKNNELSGAVMYAPRQEVTGSSFFNAPQLFNGAGGNETIRMYQYQIGLGWSWKF